MIVCVCACVYKCVYVCVSEGIQKRERERGKKGIEGKGEKEEKEAGDFMILLFLYPFQHYTLLTYKQ